MLKIKNFFFKLKGRELKGKLSQKLSLRLFLVITTALIIITRIIKIIKNFRFIIKRVIPVV